MKRFASLTVLMLAGCAMVADDPSMPSSGVWLSGDLHVHDDHSSDGSLPRQRSRDRARGNVPVAAQIGQAERQGLNFLPLTDHRTFDQYYDPQWESGKLILVPGEEANGSPHAIALGGADSIVQGEQRKDRAAFAHIQQSIWDAHSQGATWTIAHPDDGETNDDGTPNERASVQGVDLVEIWNKASDIEKEIAYSENRWNAGFRFGVAGASDSHFREYWDFQGPGFPTTHVLAAASNERGVLEGLRAGRTSLSISPNGPLLEFKAIIGGHTGIGGDDLIAAPGAKGKLRIRAQRAAGMQVIVYRQPGTAAGPFKTLTPSRDDETFDIPIAATDKPDWYRVEIRGLGIPATRPPAPPATTPVIELKAIASPVFISPSPVAAKPEIPIPPDAGGEDNVTFVIGETGSFAGFPDIAIAAGVTHFVAETHGAASSSIIYRSSAAADRWSGQKKLSGAGLARFPKIAARGRDVWVVWQEDARQVPHRPEIKLRHSADGGATWSPTETIRALDGRAEHPDIAITASGKPLIVWQEIRAGEPFDVMAQEIGVDVAPRNLSRAGKTISPGDADDSRSARYPASVWPAVTIASDGRAAIAWQDNRIDIDPLWTGSATAAGTNPDNWQIMLAIRDAGGWKTPIELGAADMADRHPDVAFGANNDLVVAWETKTLAPAGRNLSVMAAIIRTTGDTALKTLGPDPRTMSQRPRLGVDADGSVRAVWYDSRSADWRWRVMTSVWRDGWDAGTLLNGRGNNTWPVTSGGVIAFASTRNAARLQRDQTQQIFLAVP
jgi:predicted metal-dependent phosphoesterase TrpH